MTRIFSMYGIGIGAVLLFFAVPKLEFLLWDMQAVTAEMAYNPLPFAVAGIFLFSWGWKRHRNLEHQEIL